MATRTKMAGESGEFGGLAWVQLDAIGQRDANREIYRLQQAARRIAAHQHNRPHVWNYKTPGSKTSK